MPVLAKNIKVLHDYEILETFEAGLSLSGAEVKAAKLGHINLKGAYVSVRGDGAIMRNMHIGKYAPAGTQEDYGPTHDRKLLLHKKELDRLRGKQDVERLTIVPISVYTTRSLVKVELGLARGKKQYEKRASIKKRELDREIRSKLKE